MRKYSVITKSISCSRDIPVFVTCKFLRLYLLFTIQYTLLETRICGTKDDDCHEFAMCIDTGPGTKKCICKEGYSGDGKMCHGSYDYYSGYLW